MKSDFNFNRLFQALGLAAAVFVSSSAIAADEMTNLIGGCEKHICLPPKLAEGLGYFKAEGLDVALVNIPAGI
jgi:NitT/TauT family transport system substrate-binding protein